MRKRAWLILCMLTLLFAVFALCAGCGKNLPPEDYMPRELNSQESGTLMSADGKTDFVNSFHEETPVAAVVYMNGSLSRGDFFTLDAEEDKEFFDGIFDIAFSGDVTYEPTEVEDMGYYGYAYYITYFMENGQEHTIFYYLRDENNYISYDGCWFYPSKPIDTYVFSPLYDAYWEKSDEGRVQNVFVLTNNPLVGGPTRIFTPLQIDSSIPYTDMTAGEKKEFLESFDTDSVESAFIFYHGGIMAGCSCEVYRDGDEEQLEMLLDYAFSSGEFEPIREYHDGYFYEYYIVFKCSDGQELTLFFQSNGESVQFDGQSFSVPGMYFEYFSDAPVYGVWDYCKDLDRANNG